MAMAETAKVELVPTKDERVDKERKRLLKVFRPMGKDSRTCRIYLPI